MSRATATGIYTRTYGVDSGGPYVQIREHFSNMPDVGHVPGAVSVDICLEKSVVAPVVSAPLERAGWSIATTGLCLITTKIEGQQGKS